MFHGKKFIFLLLFMILLIPVNGQEKKKTEDITQKILTSDLLKIKTMSQINISPDGRKAIFVVTSMGKDKKGKYKYFNHLWVKDLTNSVTPTQLTFGNRNDSSPSWSPDSLKITFIRKHKKKPQVWILPMSGGEAFPISDAEFGAMGPKWSPDGKKILFSSSIPKWHIKGEPCWAFERPGRKRGDAPNWKKLKKTKKKDTVKARPDGTIEEIRAWLAKNASEKNPRVINRLRFQGELDLEPERSYLHLFVIEPKTGSKAEQITSGFQDFYSANWSPDSSKIVCSSLKYDLHPDRIIDSDLWMLEADGSKADLFLDWKGYMVGQPIFSPNGKIILFIAVESEKPSYSLTQLATISVKGGKPELLIPNFDRSISESLWSRDGRSIYFTIMDHGSFPLCRISANGGKVKRVIDGQIGINNYDITTDKIVYSVTEVKNPCELYQAKLNGKNIRRITSLNHNWVSKKKLSFPEERWLTRPDGFKVQYWVMEPVFKKPGKKYPLVLEIHGGPMVMWGPGEFTLWHEFQLLTSRGYGVVYCNQRGSSGYGFRFKHANYRNWGKGPAGDILAATSKAAKLDWVNPDLQFVTGGSYAGGKSRSSNNNR